MYGILLQIFQHPNSQLHHMGVDHLESPKRIIVIEEELRKAPYEVSFLRAREAGMKEITGVHDLELYRMVESSVEHEVFYFTPDTLANNHTYKAALTAVGGAIQSADTLSNSHSFAMLRPPGHHATIQLAMGFCFFNNIAIAANHLLKKNYSKIAIIDVDNHHGNGTQQIFSTNSDLLYVSLHADPRISFPGTGDVNEVGSGDGEGLSINIPLPFRTPDDHYLYAFDTIIPPVIREFKPQILLVSLGLDALLNDPYGALGLTIDGYYEIGRRIGQLAEELTNKYVGVVLEGGYKYHEIGIATSKFFEGLINHNSPSIIVPNTGQQIQEIIFRSRSVLRHYWYDV